MLTLEIVGVLGALLGLLVYGMINTHVARRQAEAKEKAEKGVPSTREEVR